MEIIEGEGFKFRVEALNFPRAITGIGKGKIAREIQNSIELKIFQTKLSSNNFISIKSSYLVFTDFLFNILMFPQIHRYDMNQHFGGEGT